MLNLLSECSFDISMLFKLKYATFNLYCGLWISHVIMTHFFTWIHKNNWFKKKATFVRSEKVEMISTFERNRHFRKMSVNKTFTHVQEQKKAMSPRHSVYIPSSVKSPLNNSSCPIHSTTTIPKTDSTANVFCECSENFWNYWESVCGGITS